eukprot:RCo047981
MVMATVTVTATLMATATASWKLVARAAGAHVDPSVRITDTDTMTTIVMGTGTGTCTGMSTAVGAALPYPVVIATLKVKIIPAMGTATCMGIPMAVLRSVKDMVTAKVRDIAVMDMDMGTATATATLTGTAMTGFVARPNAGSTGTVMARVPLVVGTGIMGCPFRTARPAVRVPVAPSAGDTAMVRLGALHVMAMAMAMAITLSSWSGAALASGMLAGAQEDPARDTAAEREGPTIMAMSITPLGALPKNAPRDTRTPT